MIKSLTAVATSTPIANHAPASVKSVKQEPAASSKVAPDTSSSDDSSSSDDETPKKVKSSATSDNVHMEDEQDYSEKSDSEKNCDGEKKSADGEKKSADGEKKSADGEKKSADDLAVEMKKDPAADLHPPPEPRSGS
ncbi:uncharacterized protein LOC127751765 [Frankliniella occidentalis]|uniref:Uncharacterized protein LOC127751765 n=1 Tax=Frankliniella occidentalis TaxID=133901 RepID=A0A9C6XUE5_FRAOC|nr:uncharacterized protein LOC127751765 [Frankliniella occidentalis]